MFTMVKIVASVASMVGLIGGTADAARTPAHPQHSALSPVRAEAAHHWPAAASLTTIVALATLKDPPPPVWEHSCARINSDGVRIHSTYSSSSAVVGLAYNGDLFKISDFPGGGWSEGTDMRNGVHGWVASDFVDLYMVHC